MDFLGWDWSIKAGSRALILGVGNEEGEEGEDEGVEKFPPCVKASVIGTFGAAAQKGRN